jgi:hypothetical protein
MQKLINGVALLSGLVSLAIVGGGAYLYTQKDALIDSAKEKVAAAAAEAITGALPGMMDAAMPELPSATGGAIGMPAATGAAIGLP